jgi:hypothetical protein
VHATVFQTLGEHWEMFFNGRINPGRVSLFWNCQTATSLRAASSAWELQARNSSVGLLLKLVQKLRPSQPSSQGSSTSSMQFLRFSSATWVRHLLWNSSQDVAQNLVKVLVHNFWQE